MNRNQLMLLLHLIELNSKIAHYKKEGWKIGKLITEKEETIEKLLLTVPE